MNGFDLPYMTPLKMQTDTCVYVYNYVDLGDF